MDSKISTLVTFALLTGCQEVGGPPKAEPCSHIEVEPDHIGNRGFSAMDAVEWLGNTHEVVVSWDEATNTTEPLVLELGSVRGSVVESDCNSGMVFSTHASVTLEGGEEGTGVATMEVGELDLREFVIDIVIDPFTPSAEHWTEADSQIEGAFDQPTVQMTLHRSSATSTASITFSEAQETATIACTRRADCAEWTLLE